MRFKRATVIVMPMKEYEIWVGYFHIGQGSPSSSKPKLLAKVKSVDFKTACIKYELGSKLERIKEGERNNNLNSQDYPWWFNENTISNRWYGKYYESRDEALKSFK